VVRGALEVTIGRISTACSRAQIGQFWIRRLWRQNVGTFVSLVGRTETFPFDPKTTDPRYEPPGPGYGVSCPARDTV
jgi:hypothetical protein